MPLRFSARLALTVLLAGLCGCTLFESRETRLMRASPDYKAGYSDGCATANAAGTAGSPAPIRDDNAFRVNRAYNLGWTSGRSMCRNIFAPSSGSSMSFPSATP